MDRIPDPIRPDRPTASAKCELSQAERPSRKLDPEKQPAFVDAYEMTLRQWACWQA
jgi:hypothetical protein